MQSYRYGETLIEIFDESPNTNGCIRITLPDGVVVYGEPNFGPEHEARAAALGYPDVWSMNREHDRIHALLAFMLGLRESPVLRAAANGGTERSELLGAEEAAVLAIQRFVNECRKTLKRGL